MENIFFLQPLTEDAVLFLRPLLDEDHSLFLELIPDRRLRLKHNFMLHYQRLGPLVHYWPMHFAAKHGFLKRLAHVTFNFRNLCKTMAFRHHMLLCFRKNKERVPGCTTPLASIEGLIKSAPALHHLLKCTYPLGTECRP